MGYDYTGPLVGAMDKMADSGRVKYNVGRQNALDKMNTERFGMEKQRFGQNNALQDLKMRGAEQSLQSGQQAQMMERMKILGPAAISVLKSPDPETAYQSTNQQLSQMFPGIMQNSPPTFGEARTHLEQVAKTWQAMNAPKPATGVKQVYDPETGQSTYARAEDAIGKQSPPRNKGPMVTVNTGGALPKGHRWLDPADQSKGVEPIPGSEPDVKRKKVEKSQTRALASAKTKFVVVKENVDKALGEIGTYNTGLIGVLLSKVPGTSAYDVSQVIDTVKANVGFDTLQAMREASPTGGALGQVSERELGQLERVLGSLQQGQSQEQLAENLMKISLHYNNWKDAVNEYYGEKPAESRNMAGESFDIPESAAFGGKNEQTGQMEYFDAQGNKI